MLSSHTDGDDGRVAMPFFPAPTALRSASTSRAGDVAARVRRCMDAHYEAVWRFLRRLGVLSSDLDDATQKVFLVLAGRVASVEPGAERSFLFASAVRVASDARRKRARSREMLADDGETFDVEDPAASAEESIDARRMRRWLDEVLDTLSEEHRAVLVLVDIEEQTMAEAADVLGIPGGTVASRLRRARDLFEDAASTLKARLEKEA
jgi:RNA polymerase sigma-70 factor, ECF subfamily